ncbi:hypothetical protein ACBP22_005042 [Escherichia coli]
MAEKECEVKHAEILPPEMAGGFQRAMFLNILSMWFLGVRSHKLICLFYFLN